VQGRAGNMEGPDYRLKTLHFHLAAATPNPESSSNLSWSRKKTRQGRKKGGSEFHTVLVENGQKGGGEAPTVNGDEQKQNGGQHNGEIFGGCRGWRCHQVRYYRVNRKRV